MKILAGWLIDGSGNPIQENMILDIQNNYIYSVKKAEEDLSIDKDLSHCTVLPGLIDSHVHLFMSGTDNEAVRKHQLDAEFDKDLITNHLKQSLSCGIIAVRDGGDNKAHALRYKTEFMNKNNFPICLKVAGKAFYRQGRYGKLIGKYILQNQRLYHAVENEIKNLPIDHIKIVNSGLNSLNEYGKQTLPQFDYEEIKEVVKSAKDLNLKVMVHANGEIPVRMAVKAGCDSIEHGFFMGKENLNLMADKDITWIPTAVTMKAYSEHLKKVNPHSSDICRKNLENQLNQISYAGQIGVKIGIGTDAGTLGVHHGKAVFEELNLFVQAGFSIQEAVKCATSNNANLLDLKHHGLIACGKSADFIFTESDTSDFFNAQFKMFSEI